MAERARDAKLPARVPRNSARRQQITRGDLAALIGVRLEDVLRLAPTREVVVTDIAGHWAASWIDRRRRARA